MKIDFLDAATVDLGDLDMRPITRLGTYRSVPRCPGGKIPRWLWDAEVMITNKVVLGKNNLGNFPKLKLICVAATGVNNIDLEEARARGIAVTNVAGYSTVTVVEHALMFLLAFGHRLLEHHHSVMEGRWSRSPFFTLLDYSFSDLQGKTLGIIGYGNIGKRVARVARTLGMKVLVGKIPGRKYPSSRSRIDLKTLLKKSDYVSLHCPLTSHTKGLMNRKRLSWMKPTAYLLNLARGPVVVEKDVARALDNKIIAGYGSDVTEVEPIPRNNPLLKKSLKGKVLLTPHVAWASRESRQRLVDEIGANIGAFKKGKRRNRVV